MLCEAHLRTSTYKHKTRKSKMNICSYVHMHTCIHVYMHIFFHVKIRTCKYVICKYVNL